MNTIPEMVFILAFLAQDVPTRDHYDRLAETHLYSNNPVIFPISLELKRGFYRVAIRDKIIKSEEKIQFERPNAFFPEGYYISRLIESAALKDEIPLDLVDRLPDIKTCELNRSLAEAHYNRIDELKKFVSPWDQEVWYDMEVEAKRYRDLWTSAAYLRSYYYTHYDYRMHVLDFLNTINYDNVENVGNYPPFPYWRLPLE